MNDLKRCPFCGSEAQLLIVPGRVAHWVVRCSKGCCNTCQYISSHDAEKAWNQRTEKEIVRCKDCKHYHNGDGSTKWLPCMEIITPQGLFCADGEQK